MGLTKVTYSMIEGAPVNILDFGAIGDGIADDGDAIRAACAASNVVYFPAGTYKFTGSSVTPLSSNFHYYGDGAGVSNIELGSGVQFFSTSTNANTIIVEKLKFTGGAGAFQWTATGANISGVKTFRDCYFSEYTRCAVEQNHADSPYWHFYNCQFYGDNSTSTMGIALGGDPSQSIIDGCEFLNNRIHIKGRQGLLNVKIQNCDFIQFDAGDGTPRAFIWAVPHSVITNAGFGLSVLGCKLGNENQQSTDYRIIYADEGSGTLNADKFPDLATSSTGYIAGHTFNTNYISGGVATPIIHSMTGNVEGIRFDNITLTGTQPTYFIEFNAAITASNYTLHNISIGAVSGTYGITSSPILTANTITQVYHQDLGAQFEGDPYNPHAYPGEGVTRATYTNYLTTKINNFLAAGGATKTADVTDATGGSEAAAFNFSGGNGLVYATLLPVAINDVNWLQFDAAQYSSSSVNQLRVRIRPSGSGAIFWERHINVTTPYGIYQEYKFPIFLAQSAANFIVEFTSISGENVALGRVRFYGSREPVAVGRTYVEQFNLSELPTSSAGLAVGSVWVDTGAGNVLKVVT